MSKVALITGITGQDGSYLSELLLADGYEVHGIMRRASTLSTERIDHIFHPEDRKFIHYGDLTEGLDRIIYRIKPDIIFNLAAQSHVWVSFHQPVYTLMANTVGVCSLLETIKQAEQTLGKQIKYYQASSSEMFGNTKTPETGYTEDSIFSPCSPYGAAKLASYWLTKTYRDGYNMFCANGILFNHSSERRGYQFASRKITRAAARIALGLQDSVELGNLEAMRDEGHSKDYMRGVKLIMEHDKPDDFVIATGVTNSIRQFGEKAFSHFNLDFYKYLKQSELLKRPKEVPRLLGDSTKMRTTLGWEPEYTFDTLIEAMCDNDYNIEKKIGV
jgi:GDPmannose 4,6-dehydratase